MHALLRRPLTAIALGLCAHAAQAEVLDFDDLTGAGYFGTSYRGFSFGNLDPASNDWYWSDAPAAPYTPHSGTTSVATDHTHYAGLAFEAASRITAGQAFVFTGAWFAGEALAADGTVARLQYQLYHQGAQVHASALSDGLSAQPLFYASGYAGLVDTVVITGPQGYFVMDDFTYLAAPVPEPAGLLLTIAGLPLVAALARRQQRRQSAQGEHA